VPIFSNDAKSLSCLGALEPPDGARDHNQTNGKITGERFFLQDSVAIAQQARRAKRLFSRAMPSRKFASRALEPPDGARDYKQTNGIARYGRWHCASTRCLVADPSSFPLAAYLA
jgi:hypothetical protein